MSDYSGTDNLEIMAEAVNYNDYLIRTVAARLQAGDQVLDFGAGIGLFAEAFARQGIAVRCLEPDRKQAAEIARKNLPVVESLESLDDESIDYVYSLNVLEHIEDDVGILKTLHRKLRPGGRILIYVPAFPILFSQMDRKVGHVRRYRKRDLERAARVAGFRLPKARYADSLGFFATLVYKLIGNKSGSINKSSLLLYDRLFFPISLFLDKVLYFAIGKNVLLVAEK